MRRNQRWPTGRAAISLTLDNMGEAAELFRGQWPEGQTIGLHYSVTEALPRVLESLRRRSLSATYFIEGWNTLHYPLAIQAVKRAGHEVAFHGWQHEPWTSLDPDTEDSGIERNVLAFARLGLKMYGFRPPGGMLNANSLTLLRKHGLTYCSPAGRDAAIVDDVVILPFDWRCIDAYYYSHSFAGLREAKGDSPDVLSPDMLYRQMTLLIDEAVDDGRYLAVLFHPHLETDPDRYAAMNEIIEGIAKNDRIWSRPCREVAEWVRSNPELFADDPGLDRTTWIR